MSAKQKRRIGENFPKATQGYAADVIARWRAGEITTQECAKWLLQVSEDYRQNKTRNSHKTAPRRSHGKIVREQDPILRAFHAWLVEYRSLNVEAATQYTNRLAVIKQHTSLQQDETLEYLQSCPNKEQSKASWRHWQIFCDTAAGSTENGVPVDTNSKHAAGG